MNEAQDGPDPLPFIGRLTATDAFRREAAAWSLGEIGSPRASRPLAGLFLREIQSVEQSGYLANTAVVSAVTTAIRRLGAIEALYALMNGLRVLTHAKGVDFETVEEIVDTIAEVGGPNAVREATDKIIKSVRECTQPTCPGLEIVASVLLQRASLCGDAALKTLDRVAHGGPPPLRPVAQRVLAGL